MADLVLKVGDSANPAHYQDGDVICAFTDKHISRVHAEHICKPSGFNSNGLRDINSMTFKMFSEFYQHRFDRVSNTEVKRTLLVNNSFEIFSDKTAKQIYVQEYIDRRLKHSKHLIFGNTGSEIWFGGRSDFSQTKIDNIWTQITAHTGKLKENHSQWPLGLQEPYDFLPLGITTDLTDAEANELVAPITEIQIIDGVETEVVTKKRKNFIDWQGIKTMSPVSIGKVNNVNTPVDKRAQYPLTLSEHLQVKNG